MKIGIQTWGSEGDINPFIALASGLSRASHNVTLAVTGSERKNYGNIAAQFGFKLGTIDHIGSSEEAIDTIGKKLFKTACPLDQLKIIYNEMFEPCVEAMYRTACALCEENELLIGHFINHPLQTAAEKKGKPYVTVSLNHGAIPTQYSAPGQLPNLGKYFNLFAWKLSEKMMNKILLPYINDLRRKEGLKDVKSFRNVWESPLCNLIAISPSLCPPAKDWGNNQKVCGFFRISQNDHEWEISEDLNRFLENGEPPVYMTLGSMTYSNKNSLLVSETTRLLFDAAKLAGCRTIIQSKWENVTEIPEDENIFRVNSSPYIKVFPRCRAVVHHGGAGTTQIATMSGRPSVIIAHIVDQFLFGSELKRLGIGAEVLNRRTVTSEKIAKQIQVVLGRKSMTENAKKTGENLIMEDGVTNAVRIIENQFLK
jgi:UDP:flavonoid glycosyltransferase YjiC (YdhE family)